jgi:NADH-quinone oxidoreductase subunit J|uniref:NADH-ubiquinone oxidoreductase chain 6 n=1 Tax=Teleaulax amphioxeia TaxID=77931 RepID=A0A2P1E6P8_9CRYP|nr:NADH dehydrogenase subunit 6 [Teleaulax amphioxeia]AVK94058.1 NADH dehydrogenase subunit 6 [Teleaulax amphioxeia]
MTFDIFLFYLFSILALLSAFCTVTSKNPIHSVLFLVFVFFNTAGLLILLGVEFLAMLFLIVYVGAVAVLFLFVMMMLNVKISESSSAIYRYLPIGLFLSILFLFEIFLIIEGDLKSVDNVVFIQSEYKILQTEFLVNTSWIDSVISPTNVDVIGSVLFTYYSYFFIMASVILLVAMIGAIALTLHRRSDVRRQDIYRQLQRDFEGATYLVDKKI